MTRISPLLLLLGVAIFCSTLGTTLSLFVLWLRSFWFISFALLHHMSFLVVTHHLLLSLGDGAINFGYPNRCFFTVGQSASGAWWLIDPKGHSFFSVGVDVVNYGGDSTAAGASTVINLDLNLNIKMTKRPYLSPSLFLSITTTQECARITML